MIVLDCSHNNVKIQYKPVRTYNGEIKAPPQKKPPRAPAEKKTR